MSNILKVIMSKIKKSTQNSVRENPHVPIAEVTIKTEPKDLALININNQKNNSLKINSIISKYGEKVLVNPSEENVDDFFAKIPKKIQKNAKIMRDNNKAAKSKEKIKTTKLKSKKKYFKIKFNISKKSKNMRTSDENQADILEYLKKYNEYAETNINSVENSKKFILNDKIKTEAIDFANSVIVKSLSTENEDIKTNSLKIKSHKTFSNQKIRRELKFGCDHCEKSFKSKYSLIWHMKDHMLTMPYTCDICGKGFSYKRSYKQHMLSHADRIKCEICEKKLKPHAVYYHMKYKHSTERNHKCPICPKTFKNKDNITRHIMRHNQSFKCEICNRGFAENSRLKMHMRLHTNPDEFLCKICNKTFEHIDKHVKRLHVLNRERRFKCSHCDYASDQKQTITRHEQMHIKREERKKGKRIGKKSKTISCEFCGVLMHNVIGYKSHLRHFHDQESKSIKNNKLKFKNNEKITEKKNDEENDGENVFENAKEIEDVEIKIEKEEISVIQ